MAIALRCWTGAVLAIGLSACVTPYAPVEFDQSGETLHTVAILDDTLPDTVLFYQTGSLGTKLGMVGLVAEAPFRDAAQSRMDDLIVALGFDGETMFEQSLIEGFAAAGIGAHVVSAERKARGLLEDYPDLPTPADAYLDVVNVGYGYVSKGVGRPYRPTLGVQVRMVSADGSERVLLDQQIIYGPVAHYASVIELEGDDSFGFAGLDEMEEDPERVISGLKTAFESVAAELTALIGHAPTPEAIEDKPS